MSPRIKINLSPRNEISALYYFALALTAPTYYDWENRRFTNFRKQFALAAKTRSIVGFDRAINHEVMQYQFERVTSNSSL